MLDGLFDTWWHRDPHYRPEFKSIVDCVQDLIEDSEEGALEDVRRKTHRLSLSPQTAHSPEFPPVSEHLAMTFEQSPIASASSRESPISFCRNSKSTHQHPTTPSLQQLSGVREVLRSSLGLV